MLYVDSNESEELYLLLGQLVPVERATLNPTLADIWWQGYGGKTVQLENKQNGELLGSLDSVEEQLSREIPEADYTGLTIRGLITPASDGMCQTWKPAGRFFRKDRVYRQSYKGFRAWVSRVEQLGVLVVEVADVQSLVVHVAAMYENSLKSEEEHGTFKRILPIKYWLKEQDHTRANMAKSLMGVVGARWGEELGLAAADYYPTLAQFYEALKDRPKEVEMVKLRSGRSVGPAAVKKMREVMGL